MCILQHTCASISAHTPFLSLSLLFSLTHPLFLLRIQTRIVPTVYTCPHTSLTFRLLAYNLSRIGNTIRLLMLAEFLKSHSIHSLIPTRYTSIHCIAHTHIHIPQRIPLNSRSDFLLPLFTEKNCYIYGVRASSNAIRIPIRELPAHTHTQTSLGHMFIRSHCQNEQPGKKATTINLYNNVY